ncbi:glycosyltransferase family protein [Candidatus Pseudomonas adelgestsugas]|uniref:Glycosyl transferase family 2 n=1 Tax=Candidatus Pseudomonas adelgestsugas TaxID=1302376 RepID=A0ABX5R8X4_9PSED|nr:hypothetical protein [Candidatus Pseudomonas adelgestsugas]QAX82013.1 hypothetical protein C3B55_00690 [Candidatus Pseudomonas adelgestsugas]
MIQNTVHSKLSILIVLYKKHYKNSVAITTLLRNAVCFNKKGISVEFFIWNNTPLCSPILSKQCLTWFEGNNNGLPYIYNRIANIAFMQGATHFMISDDDTDYSSEKYTDAVVAAMIFESRLASNLFGVMLPKMYSKEKLVSPGLRFWFFCRLATRIDSGIVTSANKLAINSGIIFNKLCYKTISPMFDERLQFYATDTAFFINYESYYAHFYVLDVALQHDLSEYTSNSVELAIFRFKEMIRGFRVIFEHKSYLFRYLMEAYLALYSVKKSFLYKKIVFFRLYIFSFKEKI